MSERVETMIVTLNQKRSLRILLGIVLHDTRGKALSLIYRWHSQRVEATLEAREHRFRVARLMQHSSAVRLLAQAMVRLVRGATAEILCRWRQGNGMAASIARGLRLLRQVMARMTNAAMLIAVQNWACGGHQQRFRNKEDAVILLETMYAQSETEKQLALEGFNELETGVEMALSERQKSNFMLQRQLEMNQRQTAVARFVASRGLQRALQRAWGLMRVDVTQCYRQWMRNELLARIQFCTESSSEVRTPTRTRTLSWATSSQCQ